MTKKVSRRGISEEVFGNFNRKGKSLIRCIPKTQEVRIIILSLIRNSILFKNLDEKDQKCVIDAMDQIWTKDSDRVINEGEKGDSLYIVADGQFQCYKNI